jgi:hypothetical protein
MITHAELLESVSRQMCREDGMSEEYWPFYSQSFAARRRAFGIAANMIIDDCINCAMRWEAAKR